MSVGSSTENLQRKVKYNKVPSINTAAITLVVLSGVCWVFTGAASFSEQYRLLFLCFGFLFFVITAGSGFFFASRINQSKASFVQDIHELFSSVKEGQADLSGIKRESAHPDTIEIHEAHEAFLSTMRQLIEGIRNIGIDIAIDSTRVAHSVQHTSAMTKEQKELSEIVSVSTVEANSAIAEVSENTQYVTEKTASNLGMAQKSHEDLLEVRDKTGKINETVRTFSGTVEDLGKSSTNILDVVSLINTISEQTHLLSLNATIEAARAGEHGKGFGIVAEEVRELAKRIKPATEEISTNVSSMINIVERTQQETKDILLFSEETDEVVGQATENFQAMINDFEMANDQLMKIAAAIEELATNNDEINQKVENIHTLSNTIAEDMEVSTKSTRMLNEVTEGMLESVSACKTGEGTFDWLIAEAINTRDVFQREIGRLKASGVNVFDSKYKEVSDTSPQKYTTSFTDVFIREIIPFHDEAKSRIKNSIYVLAIDKNGYLPAHHAEFSKPLTGDPDVDLLHSRHQRIFLNNQAEERRCSHTKKLLLQTYMRDTGEILNDLSLPIFIDGRHWGACIIGFDPKVMF